MKNDRDHCVRCKRKFKKTDPRLEVALHWYLPAPEDISSSYTSYRGLYCERCGRDPIEYVLNRGIGGGIE
jgi:hypothetical protein